MALRPRQVSHFSQPQGFVKPDDRWVARGLVYATRLIGGMPFGQVNTPEIASGTKVVANQWGLARGFGATLGVNASDILTTPITNQPVRRSYVFSAYLRGVGGNNVGRFFDKDIGSEFCYFDAVTGTLAYSRIYSGGQNTWNSAAAGVGTGQRYVFGIAIDTTSGLTGPDFYINGNPTTVAGGGAGGTVTNNTQAITLGNRVSDFARVLDGAMDSFYIFDDVLLSADEFEELGDVSKLWEPATIWVPAGVTPPSGTAVNPDVGTLTITGPPPTVSQSSLNAVIPDTGNLTITGPVPTVAQTTHLALVPGTGALVITGYAPTVAQTSASSIVPATGTITITGYAPTIAKSANQIILPAQGPIVITGYAPTVAQSSNRQVIPGVGSISIVGYAPTVVQGAGRNVLPLTGSIVITGPIPVVTRTLNNNLFPGQGNLVITGHAPSVVRTTGGGGGLSATDVWTYEIEAGRTAEEALRLMLAVLCGKTTVTDLGGGLALVTFEASNGTKIRVTASMTGSERTSMSYNDTF